MKEAMDEARQEAMAANASDPATFVVSDVYHGSEYRRIWGDLLSSAEPRLTLSLWLGAPHSSTSDFHHPADVLLALRVDGGALFKGLSNSQQKIWPLLFRIEENPLCSR
jgi:hypothetical protein